MLPFEEALARILALGSPPLPAENVPVDEADGRILAEDLVSSVDLPGFDYSTMDGYAIRAGALESAPRLPVRGESKTGCVPAPLAAGTTMRIFTGAPIPEGADAVVMQEHVERTDDVAAFGRPARPGQNVRRRGDDLAAGAIAITRGTRLLPAHLGLASALDLAEVRVFGRPEIAIVATGDELRRPGTPAAPGTIPESNTVALRAIARRAGGRARAVPFVPDDRGATERAFAAVLEEADVVVTIGGVSVGDHDLVRPALEAVGVTLDFWRVALKPGKPLAVGRKPRPGRRDAIVLGLPGNPASALVTFALFGAPLIRALGGDAAPFPPRRRARLGKAIAHEPGRLELVRAVLSEEGGDRVVTPLANQASGAVTTMATANALVMIPAASAGVEAGVEVDVLTFSELHGGVG